MFHGCDRRCAFPPLPLLASFRLFFVVKLQENFHPLYNGQLSSNPVKAIFEVPPEGLFQARKQRTSQVMVLVHSHHPRTCIKRLKVVLLVIFLIATWAVGELSESRES